MKTELKFFFVALLLSFLGTNESKAQYINEGLCYFTGQIATNAASAGAFAVCLNTGNPAACRIGYAILSCAENPACDGVIAEFTEKGCTYTVIKIGNAYEIQAEAFEQNLNELKRTYNSLNSVEGVQWLYRYFTH